MSDGGEEASGWAESNYPFGRWCSRSAIRYPRVNSVSRFVLLSKRHSITVSFTPLHCPLDSQDCQLIH
jgi:hypothetical protein